MRFRERRHTSYCGIDLHVKTMYVCILDATGQVLVRRNASSTPAVLLEVIAPYREDLVVAGECLFTWYWLADVCAAEGIAFVLGHAIESVVLNELERRGAEVGYVKTSDGLDVGEIVASSADSISLDAYWHTGEAVEVPAPMFAKEYRYLLNVFVCSSDEVGAVRINYNT